MSEWRDRLIQRAAKDPELMNRLIEIQELDSKCSPGISMGAVPVRGATIDDEIQRMQSAEWQAMALRVSVLCDEVSQMVATPGDDCDEIATWVSFNCHSVLLHLREELKRMQRRIRWIALSYVACFIAVYVIALNYMGLWQAFLTSLVLAALLGSIVAWMFFPTLKTP